MNTQTEQLIQQALQELLRDRTAPVDAHRLSTLRHADRIVVFEGGRIVEQVTHGEPYRVWKACARGSRLMPGS